MEEPKMRGIAARQREADDALGEYIKRNTPVKNEENGVWRWKDYGLLIEKTSVMVIGERVADGNLELTYLVTFHSECPIPHVGQTRHVTSGKKVHGEPFGTFTYVQLGNSAYTPLNVTLTMVNYVGSEPPLPLKPPG
jgi:hypothetical protein